MPYPTFNIFSCGPVLVAHFKANVMYNGNFYFYCNVPISDRDKILHKIALHFLSDIHTDLYAVRKKYKKQ